MEQLRFVGWLINLEYSVVPIKIRLISGSSVTPRRIIMYILLAEVQNIDCFVTTATENSRDLVTATDPVRCVMELA